MKTYLLQSNIDKPELNDFLIPAVIFCVAFLLCIAITRAIFSIPKFLRYQKANTLLNIKTARALGVSENEIEDIIDIIDARPGKYTKDYPERYIDNMRNASSAQEENNQV